MQHQFPPRGSGVPDRGEGGPAAGWTFPQALGPEWSWKRGHILLGRDKGRLLGIKDDRHCVTIAPSRSGKSRTVLMYNAAEWPGSLIVTDPKGEIARATAQIRRDMGQEVHIMAPFGGETFLSSAAYNPFDELGHGVAEHIPADAALAGDALIVPNERDPHWTDSARNLIRGIVLHLLDRDGTVTIRALRRALSSTNAELDALLVEMADSNAFDGIVGNIGSAFLAKFTEGTREFSSILSTAQEQTAPLDDIRGISDRSDFRMADLHKGNTTIYLVLPGMRMATHSRWLRLMVQSALSAMERHPVAYGEPPVLFMLEEFPTLGYMQSIETAAGLLAGSGVKLWLALQNLGQLKRHYPHSWETFVGNAGFLQAFANSDLETTECLSRMLGTTQVLERQTVRLSAATMRQGDNGEREHQRSVPLLDPAEIRHFFSRATNRQLVLIPEHSPIFMERMEHYEE